MLRKIQEESSAIWMDVAAERRIKKRLNHPKVCSATSEVFAALSAYLGFLNSGGIRCFVTGEIPGERGKKRRGVGDGGFELDGCSGKAKPESSLSSMFPSTHDKFYWFSLPTCNHPMFRILLELQASRPLPTSNLIATQGNLIRTLVWCSMLYPLRRALANVECFVAVRHPRRDSKINFARSLGFDERIFSEPTSTFLQYIDVIHYSRKKICLASHLCLMPRQQVHSSIESSSFS